MRKFPVLSPTGSKLPLGDIQYLRRQEYIGGQVVPQMSTFWVSGLRRHLPPGFKGNFFFKSNIFKKANIHHFANFQDCF